MSSPERGTLLIADLSGYTEYLVRTEIEHSSAIVADLLDRVIGAIEPVFNVNGTEGDAVLAWSPEGELDASRLLAVVDATYAEFRYRALSVHRATTCTCQACGLVPNLDLKLVAHHGSFVRHALAGREELTGRDVIVAHRLLKNSLGYSGPESGYLMVTTTAAEALGLDPVSEGMSSHIESYEHIGEIRSWTVGLHDRWATAPEWGTDQPPVVDVDARFPAPLDEVWSALAPGASDTCATAILDELPEIIEWRPFKRFVVRITHDGFRAIHEGRFEEEGSDTTVALRWYADGHHLPDNGGVVELQRVTEKVLADNRHLSRPRFRV